MDRELQKIWRGLSFVSKDVGQVLTVAGNSTPINYFPKTKKKKNLRHPLDQLFVFYGYNKVCTL
jgi:hypothetical protein